MSYLGNGKRSAVRMLLFIILGLFVKPLFALSIDVSGINNPVAPNGLVYYRILVANTDGVDRSNVTVSAPIPEYGFLYESRTMPLTNGLCTSYTCDFGETVVWNLGELGAGESRVITMAFNVTASAPDGSNLALTATVTHASDIDGQSATYTAVVIPTVKARLSLSPDSQVAAPGEHLRYEVSFGNVSGSSFTNTELQVELPAGVSFDMASDGGSLAGGIITWDLENLGSGDGGKRFFTVTLENNLSDGTILPMKSALLDDGVEVSDAKDSVAVKDNVKLTLDVTTIGDRSQPGSYTYYRYVVANKGATNLADVNLRLMMAERSFYTEAASAPVVASLCYSYTCEAGEWNTFEVGELAAGESWTVTIPVRRLSPLAGEPMVSHALVTEGSGAYALGTRPTVRSSDGPDLQLVLVADSFTVDGGASQNIEVWTGNPSGSSEQNLVVSVEVPNGYTVTSASGTAEQVGNTLHWPIGNLSAGTWVKEYFTVVADAGQPEGLALTLRGAIRDDSVLGSIASASLTSVVTSETLDYSIEAVPDTSPLAGSSAFAINVNTNNSTGVQYADVNAYLMIPTGTSALVSDSGIVNCSSNRCDPGEWGRWSIGVLNDGVTDSRSITASVGTAVEPGQLMVGNAALGHSTRPTRGPALFFALGVGNAFTVDPNHDSDNDGIPDWWEIRHGYDRLDASDATTDDDGDGSENLEEYQEGTSPILMDTDGDGILDGPDSSLTDDLPVANAGPDQSVISKAEVTLNGNGSSQPDDPTNSAPLTYSWSQTSGTTVTLSDFSDPQPTFTAPMVFDPETLVFELLIRDATDNTDTDSIVVKVLPGSEDVAPVADAGPDQPSTGKILPGDTVTLNGSNSSDVPDPLEDLTFSWSEITSSGVVLSDTSATMPTFTAPDLGATGGTLEFELTVEDTAGQSNADTVLINISTFEPPVANAGPDQNVQVGATVTLNGNNSTDSDGDIVGYNWTQEKGETVSLSEADSATPSFTAPDVSSAMLEFQLEVTDSQGLKDTDKTVVNVSRDPAPVCLAGANQEVPEYTSGQLTEVTLDASASSIVEGSIGSYLWAHESGPAVTLSTPNQVSTTFTVPEVLQAGASLTFKVTCTSDLGVVRNDTVTINIVDVNRPPKADAGDDQVDVSSGAQILLNAGGSMDPDGDAVSYLWTQLSGTSVTLSDPTSAAPTFTAPDAPAAGLTLVFEVTVSDSDLSNTDEVTITIFGLGNTAPQANAGPDQTVDPETTVSLDATGSSDAETSFAQLILQWEQLSGPTVALSSTGAAQPDFAAPATSDANVELVFRLTVTDEGGQSVSDEVLVTVRSTETGVAEEGNSGAGGGCTVVEGGAPDPTLPLLALVSLFFIHRKRLSSSFR